MRRRSDQDLLIGPGTRLIIEPVGADRKISTEYVGMVKDKCLITRLPKNAIDLAFLVRDSFLTVKYVQGGHHVTAFQTTVLGTSTQPVSLLFLNIPNSIESIDVRQTDRLQCFVPTSVYIEGHSNQGLILDLSVGGCKLVIVTPAEHGASQVQVGAEIVIHFNLFDDDVAMFASGIVRTVSDSGLIGIQFLNLVSEVEDSIQNYIGKVREYMLG